MTEIITETLLEMHYHHAIIDCFKSVYGVNFLRLLKPSPQQEAWVGFDQGWVRTNVSTGTLFQELRMAITNQAKSVQNLYLGYFMQYKMVKRLSKKSKYCPGGYSTPYLRVELTLTPNKISGISQHETLLRLTAINNTAVYYVCPMRFSPDELYEEPNVDHLQCVDLKSAPSGWLTNSPHFIMFQREDDPSPQWCSEPSSARVFKLREWVENRNYGPPKLTAEELIGLIQDSVRIIKEERTWYSEREQDPIKLLPECFTIVEFGKTEEGT